MTTTHTRSVTASGQVWPLQLAIIFACALVFAFATSASAQTTDPAPDPAARIDADVAPGREFATGAPISIEEFAAFTGLQAPPQSETPADPNLIEPAAWERTLIVYMPTVQAQVDASSLDLANRASVRAFYNAHFSKAVPPMNWTGNYAACQPGVTSAAYLDATLDRINYYRAMAGVPSQVAMHQPFVQQAQAAALMMSANSELSHTPSRDWNCYSEEGAKAAGAANLASAPGPQAIDLYMEDSGGGNHAVGHRRWLLLPQLKRIGAGSTPDVQSAWGSNVLYVIDSESIWDARPAVRDTWVAWPPRGYVPYTIVPMRWSLSLPKADFSRATITMRINNSPVSVIKEPIATGYGENTVAWTPQIGASKWPRPGADATVQITVSGVIAGSQNQTIAYTVVIFDPG